MRYRFVEMVLDEFDFEPEHEHSIAHTRELAIAPRVLDAAEPRVTRNRAISITGFVGFGAGATALVVTYFL